MATPTACRVCGRVFTPRKGGPLRYCTPCRNRAAREAARVLRAKCKECGRAFSTSSRVVRYCSDPCRKKGYARVRNAHRYPRRDRDGTAKCLACGKVFATDGGPGKSLSICSDACRAERERTRNREYMRKYLADPKKRAIQLARSRAARSKAKGKRGR